MARMYRINIFQNKFINIDIRDNEVVLLLKTVFFYNYIFLNLVSFNNVNIFTLFFKRKKKQK